MGSRVFFEGWRLDERLRGIPRRKAARNDVIREGMVPRRGLEPPRPCDHYDLNVARLPVPPPGHFGKIRLVDFDAGVGECQRAGAEHCGDSFVGRISVKRGGIKISLVKI